jgi:hypothetical protein
MTVLGSELLENKRLLWQDARRNRVVASTAKRLATTVPGHVVLVVESLDHALALITRVKDWILVTGPDPNLTGLSESKRRLVLGDCRPGAPSRSIMPARKFLATFASLAELDWALVDLVIRADGGTGELPLPAKALNTASDRAPLRVVDITDGHAPFWRMRAHQRQAAYEAIGWATPEQDAATHRLDRFLALSRKKA